MDHCQNTFNAIREQVEAGRPINHPDQYGTSLLYDFLSAYYPSPSHSEDTPFDLQLTLPLEKRKDKVLPFLQWFLDQGVDVNVGRFLFPLTLAVGRSDVPMTEWLLAHGADLSVCPEDEIPEPNYCLFMMDNYWTLSEKIGDFDPQEQEATRKMLRLLFEHGVRGEGQTVRITEEGAFIHDEKV